MASLRQAYAGVSVVEAGGAVVAIAVAGTKLQQNPVFMNTRF